MRGLTRNSDITFGSRYECKYLVSEMLVPDFRRFIEPFMQPDRFAALRERFSYPVCSLYLDTDDLRLYRQVVGGEKKRFKLRARTYSDDPATPVFLEVKRKINNIVAKRRARVTREEARTMLTAGLSGWLQRLHVDQDPELDYFAHHTRLSEAKPVIKVRYMREAYESRAGDPVRITLDTELIHAATFDDDLTHGLGQWVDTPLRHQILEIKFTERFPRWVSEAVQMFGLKQQAVPKYAMSIEHMLEHGRASAMSVAGFTLPPLRT